MYFDNLNDDNFTMFCAKAYDKPHCVMSEMNEDLKRIKYIKRLFRRYKNTGKIKERLALNHIIILYNVFGESATRILFFKIDAEYYEILKTFLLFLNYMPDIVYGIEGKTIDSKDVSIDIKLAVLLRKI